MTRPVDIGQIVALLNDRLEALVARLLPKGRREGAEWVEARRNAGGLGDSLKVHLGPSRRGIWQHFAAGVGGDALELVCYLQTGGDKRAAIAWSRAFLGIDGADAGVLRHDARRAAAATARRQAADAEDSARNRGAAYRVYLEAEPSLAGTPAARYLAGRGIDLARLGRQPAALRYHPHCWCVEVQDYLPAMVAAIAGDSGFAGVHRTYLAAGAGGAVGKADLKAPKKTLGRWKGGSIRLWRGASGKGLRHAPGGDVVVISEGIEDGLTAALHRPDFRVLAAVSVGNMANIVLPKAIGTVFIAAQNDAADSQAANALQNALHHFHAEGFDVMRITPPGGAHDLNELEQISGPPAGKLHDVNELETT